MSISNWFGLFGLPAGTEIWVILILILVLFGGTKIPELMRGVGKGVGELKKGLDEGRRSIEEEVHKEPEPKPIDPEPKKSS